MQHEGISNALSQMKKATQKSIYYVIEFLTLQEKQTTIGTNNKKNQRKN